MSESIPPPFYHQTCQLSADISCERDWEAHKPSMENLDISEPQFPSCVQKDQYNSIFHVFFSFNGRRTISPIETRIVRWKFEFIKLFAHLTELEVLNHLPSFPYTGHKQEIR